MTRLFHNLVTRSWGNWTARWTRPVHWKFHRRWRCVRGVEVDTRRRCWSESRWRESWWRSWRRRRWVKPSRRWVWSENRSVSSSWWIHHCCVVLVCIFVCIGWRFGFCKGVFGSSIWQTWLYSRYVFIGLKKWFTLNHG